MTGGLAALLLLVPIVLAYRRLPPRTRHVVPSLVLLRRLGSAAVVARRARRIEHVVLLALLSAALVALVLGLVAPRDDRPALLVLDNSPSMAAQAGDRPRIERAQSELVRWLEAHPDAPAGLLSTGEPALSISPTVDHTRVRRAIADAGQRVDRDWTALAADACRDERLVVASDGPYAPPCDAFLVDLGSREANGGLVAAAVRPTDALDGIEVAVVGAGALAPLIVSGGSSSPATFTLSRESNDAVFHITAPHGAFTIDLPGGDALAADDSIRVARTPLVRAVLLTNDPAGFTARALDAHPGVTLQIAAPDGALPGEADVVVVEDPPAQPLPAAKVVLWLGTAEGSGFAVDHVADHPKPRASTSAWLHYVDPAAIHIASSLVFAAGPNVVLESSRGPLAVERDTPDGAALAVGFGPRTSDLGLDVAFLHLLANVIDAARPSVRAVEGLLSRTETLASPPTPSVRADRVVAWRWGGGIAFVCLLAEGLLTHLLRRRA